MKKLNGQLNLNTLLVTCCIGLVAYFGKRTIAQIDSQFAQLNRRVTSLETANSDVKSQIKVLQMQVHQPLHSPKS